ncbi:inosine-uridine nucleoside n-ribohydrolase [Stylonychia lemnae]|uniref:Inosine-uridine nucleoside n-ribohydrolase n=1 Tax=Stylonychia lemnae TaxID=5949 RepID=A0A078B3H5_STYLE|nr:inosine-uridine nucleoside n-ribohydrolase [Stylonychia lemnae]|eukprot:CDW88058.1 inosine-uridine nucleoside n-ribohydrolase [Stylonychia lemnae]
MYYQVDETNDYYKSGGVKVIVNVDQKLIRDTVIDCLGSLYLKPDAYTEERFYYQSTLQIYLEALGIPNYMKISPSVETLFFIHNKHIMTIPYQNIHFHLKDRQPYSFYFRELVDRIVVQKNGGLCYEQCALMYHVYKTIGFDVKILFATVTKGHEHTFNPYEFQSHAFLMIKVDGQEYLVDGWFGSEAPCYPLAIDLGKDEQIIQINKYIKFCLVRYENYYELKQWYGNYWERQYVFFRPLVFKDIVEIYDQYLRNIYQEYYSPIRDKYMLIGKSSQYGFFQAFMIPSAYQFVAYNVSFIHGVAYYKKYENLEKFKDEVYWESGIIIPDFYYIKTDSQIEK